MVNMVPFRSNLGRRTLKEASAVSRPNRLSHAFARGLGRWLVELQEQDRRLSFLQFLTGN